jgi:meiotic recombination protein SPO11
MSTTKKRKAAPESFVELSDSESDEVAVVTKSSNKGSASKAKSNSKRNADIDYSQKPPSEVLKEINLLRKSMQQSSARKSSSSSSSSSSAKTTSVAVEAAGEINITEVEELPCEEVTKKIEDVVVSIVSDILGGGSFELSIPNRSSSNQIYLEEIDRIVLGDKISKRQFLNTAHVRKTAITTRVLQLVHEVLSKGIHITKRDLFYTDVKLFKDQLDSDAVLDDVACMVGCTRTSLHVVASDKGLVVGRIQYRESGDLIDCTRMGVGGKAIPPYIDKISDIQSDAQFIILVEKEAAYMRLAEDRFYNKYPCIVITGKGQPDVATRLFLRKVKDQLNIPVLALVDSDPYGLKILSVYCSGSKQMSYDSCHLTTTDIKWLGVWSLDFHLLTWRLFVGTYFQVRPSDLDKFNLPAQCRLPMTDHDKKMGEELLKEPFITRNPRWVQELELMLKTGEKAEIQVVCPTELTITACIPDR